MMFSCIQDRVLEPRDAQTLKLWLEGLPRNNFFYEGSTGRLGLHKVQPLSHRYIDPDDSWFSVSFDENCQVISEEITLPFKDLIQVETLKKTVSVALSCMAKHGQWQSQTCRMSMSIMQHHDLKKGFITKPIPWHRDASDYTQVILLDDERRWSGGDFLFKFDENDVERYCPKLGYGVFFSNHASKHCVERLVANSDGIDRTILSLHCKT